MKIINWKHCFMLGKYKRNITGMLYQYSLPGDPYTTYFWPIEQIG